MKKSSIVLIFPLFSFFKPHNPNRKSVTGRTEAELEVHTKKFYSTKEWKKILNGL